MNPTCQPTLTLQDLRNLNALVSRIDTFCLAVSSLQETPPVRDLMSLEVMSQEIQDDVHEVYDNLEIQFSSVEDSFDDDADDDEDDARCIEELLKGESK